jgi:hypothetical protein
MERISENIETPEERSLKAMRKAAWGIFVFQWVFLLIFILRTWDAMLQGAGLTIATALYTLAFTGLMLDILVKPVEQLNYRATELKLTLTSVLFCIPALCLAYYMFINMYKH